MISKSDVAMHASQMIDNLQKHLVTLSKIMKLLGAVHVEAS